MKSLKEAENKGFCSGVHQLTYGAWQERQEAEIEIITELEENKADPIQALIQRYEKGGDK
jgi:hypothetical protein